MLSISTRTAELVRPVIQKTLIQFEVFRAQLGGGFAQGEVETSFPADANLSELKAMILKSLDEAKADFEKVLRPMRRRLDIMSGILFVGIAIAIVLGSLSVVSPYLGVPLSVGVLSGLFGILRRTWRLARDQAALELAPAIYKVAFTACTSQAQVKEILDSWMNSINSIPPAAIN